jgi:hypothetical protein
MIYLLLELIYLAEVSYVVFYVSGIYEVGVAVFFASVYMSNTMGRTDAVIERIRSELLINKYTRG